MKINLLSIPTTTLEAFADTHGLEMTVQRIQRRPEEPETCLAYFPGALVKQGNVCVNVFGEGSDPDAAIEHYRRLITGQVLVMRAGEKGQMEIRVPRLEPYSGVTGKNWPAWLAGTEGQKAEVN